MVVLRTMDLGVGLARRGPVGVRFALAQRHLGASTAVQNVWKVL